MCSCFFFRFSLIFTTIDWVKLNRFSRIQLRRLNYVLLNPVPLISLKIFKTLYTFSLFFRIAYNTVNTESKWYIKIMYVHVHTLVSLCYYSVHSFLLDKYEKNKEIHFICWMKLLIIIETARNKFYSGYIITSIKFNKFTDSKMLYRIKRKVLLSL